MNLKARFSQHHIRTSHHTSLLEREGLETEGLLRVRTGMASNPKSNVFRLFVRELRRKNGSKHPIVLATIERCVYASAFVMTREAASDASLRLERLLALAQQLEAEHADSAAARFHLETVLREIDDLRKLETVLRGIDDLRKKAKP
jgi:hypothetical protein